MLLVQNSKVVRRMPRDVAMHNATTIMADDEEAVEHPKRQRRYSEKVRRSDGFSVVSQKRKATFCGLRAPACSLYPARDGGLTDDSVCAWAISDIDCPLKGCFAFGVTLPTNFATGVSTTPPAPIKFTDDPNYANDWGIPLTPVDKKISGTQCYYSSPPYDEIGAKSCTCTLIALSSRSRTRKYVDASLELAVKTTLFGAELIRTVPNRVATDLAFKIG